MMGTQYKIEEDGSVSITLNMKLSGTYLQKEEQITEAVNAAGRLASELALKDYDTDGRPIVVGNEKYTSKGQKKKSTRHRGGRLK